ncbi:pirin family protein [Leptolyngbya sp. AN03gr2]|uniref:pirin family protein n=1 Tax=unclassified Leptolyngbya TaxID=2650499 RepID=UPI003D314625
MLTLRKANDRGHADHGWLNSYHTFSFASYYDPAHMGFRKLRVINEDRVAGGGGFAPHSHRDMEIISYVLEGGLEHQDSMGNQSVIRPGEVQRMTAGTGVTHSEYNASKTDTAHFLQIWVLPERSNLTPGYEQKFYTPEEKQGKLRLIASQDGRDGSVTVHQDLSLYATVLGNGEKVTHDIAPQRHLWVQIARGSAIVNGEVLSAGDAAAIEAEPALELIGQEDAEILVFDLA